ncbi:type II toxin-antitoxin system Phd/YefM family antitoxin [Patescibacteria group bacterium]|nr:type II toxin-antitoxin system Phd/YefM family antitoxin [Patescibacteria group bacterium]
MAKKTISITEGRRKLFKIAEEIQKPDTYYVFTVGGEPRVVLMSRDEFESIMETIEIMSDQEIVKDLRQAEMDFKKGEHVSWEEVKKEMGFKDADLILRDRSKIKYSGKKNGKNK